MMSPQDTLISKSESFRGDDIDEHEFTPAAVMRQIF
jgi:hypothetical protein